MADVAVQVDKSTNVRTQKKPAAVTTLSTVLRATGALSPALAGSIAARAFFSTPPRRPTSKTEAAILASGERHELRHDGETLVYVEWGEGRPVILMHGWGGSAAQMTPLVGALLERGFRVQAIDAPGHGESSGSWASIPRFASALSALAATHPAGAAVVAHSMGSAATMLAIANGALVQRAAYVGPPSDARDWFDTFEKTLELSPEVAVAALSAIEAKAGVPIAELRAVTLGPRVRVPVLVIHDEDDREVAFRHGEVVAGSVEGARLVRTHGLGHRRILAAPPVHQTIADFLTQLAPRSRSRAA